MYEREIGGLLFVWDRTKERVSRRKHGVSFVEAATAFGDPQAWRYFDGEHSDDEDRFILLGLSRATRLLIVCHCYREDSRTIRLISARKADAKETKDYERQRHHA
jgi:uncharacterized protein